jgi:hypothetical protein
MVRSLRCSYTNSGPRRYATNLPKRTRRLPAHREGQTDSERAAAPLPCALRSRYASMKLREVPDDRESKAQTAMSVPLRG